LAAITQLQKRVLNGKQEAWTLEQLKALLRQRRKHWIVQAILKTQRVLKQNNLDPNYFFFDTFFNTLMKGWEQRNSTQETVFVKFFFFFMCHTHLFKRKPNRKNGNSNSKYYGIGFKRTAEDF
jgi:hypothetical protein